MKNAEIAKKTTASVLVSATPCVAATLMASSTASSPNSVVNLITGFIATEDDSLDWLFRHDQPGPEEKDYDRFLRRIREDADTAGLQISICGEAAGRPLEALAFVALGFRRLSMPASGIGPVKRLVRSVDAGAARAAMANLLESNAASVRPDLTEFARSSGFAL